LALAGHLEKGADCSAKRHYTIGVHPETFKAFINVDYRDDDLPETQGPGRIANSQLPYFSMEASVVLQDPDQANDITITSPFNSTETVSRDTSYLEPSVAGHHGIAPDQMLRDTYGNSILMPSLGVLEASGDSQLPDTQAALSCRQITTSTNTVNSGTSREHPALDHAPTEEQSGGDSIESHRGEGNDTVSLLDQLLPETRKWDIACLELSQVEPSTILTDSELPDTQCPFSFRQAPVFANAEGSEAPQTSITLGTPLTGEAQKAKTNELDPLGEKERSNEMAGCIVPGKQLGRDLANLHSSIDIDINNPGPNFDPSLPPSDVLFSFSDSANAENSLPTDSPCNKPPLNKLTCRERKRTVASSSRPPRLTKASKQWIAKTQWLLDPFREDDECWFHPSPPIPRVAANGTLRPCGKLQKSFTWQDWQGKHSIVLNYGIVSKLVYHKLTKQQKDGFINKQWHLSHLCGNWTCLNPDHTTVEPGSVNLSRNNCFSHRSGCLHTPPCMKERKVPLGVDGKPVDHNAPVIMSSGNMMEEWENWTQDLSDWHNLLNYEGNEDYDLVATNDEEVDDYMSYSDWVILHCLMTKVSTREF